MRLPTIAFLLLRAFFIRPPPMALLLRVAHMPKFILQSFSNGRLVLHQSPTFMAQLEMLNTEIHPASAAMNHAMNKFAASRPSAQLTTLALPLPLIFIHRLWKVGECMVQMNGMIPSRSQTRPCNVFSSQVSLLSKFSIFSFGTCT